MFDASFFVTNRYLQTKTPLGSRIEKRRKKMEDDRESLKMNHLKILVRSIGLPGSWGKGDTIEEARKIAGKPKYYEVYLVTYDTTCDFTDGGFWFDRKYPPKLIHAVLPKKKSTKKT